MNILEKSAGQSGFMELAWWVRAAAYSGSGAIGTGCHYLLLIGMVSALHLPVVPSTAAGALAGAAVNYILNYRVVFRSKRPHRQALPRFIAIATASVLLNILVVAELLRLFNLHYLTAQIIATACVLVTGFLLNQYWTFGE